MMETNNTCRTCETCGHGKVCKYRETFELMGVTRINAIIDDINEQMKDADIHISAAMTCSSYVLYKNTRGDAELDSSYPIIGVKRKNLSDLMDKGPDVII